MDNKMDENQDLIDMDLTKFKDILSKESQAIDDKLNEIEITKRKDSSKIIPVDPHPEELEKLMEIDETDNTIVIENPVVCDRNDIGPGAAVVTSPNNKSLGLIANYNSSSDSDSSSSSSAENSDSSDDDSSSDSSDSDIADSDGSSSSSTDDDEVVLIETDNENNANRKKPRATSLRVKGEKLVTELPPIEELRITVPETACTEIGKIQSIVDQLVLVDSLPGFAALDLDTVLFLEKGKRPLGKVFDVLGQIAKPLYCIRFNSRSQISESAIEVGMKVYFAPQSEHTQYVILTDIMKKGSDASWIDDIEPNPNNLDYSDDEQERVARKSLKQLRTSDSGGQQKSETNRKHRTSDKRNYYPNANHHNQPRFRGGYNPGGDPNFNYSWHQNLPQSMIPGTSYANPYAMSMSGFPTQVSPHLLQYPPPPPPPPQESEEQ